MSDQSVQTKSTQIACIVDLEGQRGEIQGGFFWWSSRFSVPKWKKTMCSQQDFLEKKLNVKWLLEAGFSFWFWKNGGTVKCPDKKYTDGIYCRSGRSKRGNTLLSSVYLLAWQTKIIANPIQPGFVAESGFIVPSWMPLHDVRSPFRTEKKFIT